MKVASCDICYEETRTVRNSICACLCGRAACAEHSTKGTCHVCTVQARPRQHWKAEPRTLSTFEEEPIGKALKTIKKQMANATRKHAGKYKMAR